MNENDITVNIHGVNIRGVTIPRPTNTAISEWMGFWEAVQALAATGTFGATEERPAKRAAQGYYRG